MTNAVYDKCCAQMLCTNAGGAHAAPNTNTTIATINTTIETDESADVMHSMTYDYACCIEYEARTNAVANSEKYRISPFLNTR